MKIDNKRFAWLVAYIDRTQIDKVDKDLRKYPQFNEVEAYIPTIQILKKTFKGKDTFENVPLLFNYGFFKVPRKYAIHASYLEDLQRNINCIYAWVKDPLKRVNQSLTNIEEDIADSAIRVATAHPKEIAKLVKDSFAFSAHDSTEVHSLKPGDIVTLRGYPFDGISAEFISMNEKKQTAQMKIQIFDVLKEVSVSFDNLFYTIYKDENYNDEVSTLQSIDKMAETSHLDKATFKNYQKNNGTD